MSEILNPYIAGAPVVETSMFFGRADIFSWIERSLTGKFVNHILVLHGQRRVGKTSVLKQIPNHLPNRYIQVFFDLQGRTNTTLDRFLWWMASEIVRTMKKDTDLDLPKPDRSAFSDTEVFISEFLPSLRPALGERILLLTFDEFDTLDRPDIQESLAQPLIAYLRRLIDMDGLNFIFSIGSSGNKLENMQASYTDFFKAALYRKVSFLTTDDCISLITKPVEGVITYDPQAVEKITFYTSGHPYFTQLMCHELFSRCQKTGSRLIKPADVDDILPDVIERGTVNLKFVWDEASDLEKWTLAALAQEEGIPLRSISQVLKAQSVRFSEADLNSGILHLRDKDVLTQDNHFVIHLLKLWLVANRPMDRVREELVQTNPIADRYNEIGDEYHERGELEQAIQSYQQALAAQRNNSRALISIGNVHQSRNEHHKAAEVYEQVLKFDDENIAARQGFSQAQLMLAQAAHAQGMDDAAISAYKAVLQYNPVNSQARRQLADLFQQQAEVMLSSGAYDQAVEKLQQALELVPEDAQLDAKLDQVAGEKKASEIRGWVQKADKALARQRFDEAARMIEEAINIDPDDQDLRKRLLDIRDSPRQERIKAYRHEAELAIAKGNYPKAISAIETAVLLAPEDKGLSDWLSELRSDQSNAQLHLYQAQAAQAEANGDWDGAVTAREAALRLDPGNEGLKAALLSAQAGREQAQIAGLRARVDSACKGGRWLEALEAMQALITLTPQDPAATSELESIRVEHRKGKLRDLKQQAENAVRQEKWDVAQQAWLAYLAEVPEEADLIERQISQAKKKGALLTDYEAAQGLIKKRQFSKAIHLLQGIIAQDPTYRSSSRLLVEAVEANKQRKPLFKQPWLYIGLSVILLALLVVVFLPRIRGWVGSIPEGRATETALPHAIYSEADCPRQEVLCVGMVTDTGGVDDRSFNQSAWAALQQAETELGVLINFVNSETEADYLPNIQYFIDKNYDVIVTVGWALVEVTIDAARSNPETWFIGIDQFQDNDVLPNLTVLIFDEHKAGFLAGVLAGMVSRTGTVAAVLATETIPPVVRFNEGYVMGVRYIDSSINILATYHPGDVSTSFFDPEWGADTARKSIEKGADVIFGVGAETGNGAVMAAAEIEGVYCIGVDSDQYFTLPGAQGCLVSSAIKLITPGVFDLLNMVKEGNAPTGNYIGDDGLAPFHDFDTIITQEMRNKLTMAEADYDAGLIKISADVVGEIPSVIVDEDLKMILDQIKASPPTATFTDPSEEWQFGVDGGLVRLSDFLSDKGRLAIDQSTSDLDQNDITFPRDPFDGMNSVISFKVDAENFNLPATFGLRLRWDDGNPDYLQVYFSRQENRFYILGGIGSPFIREGYLDLSIERQLMFICYGQHLAMFTDEILLHLWQFDVAHASSNNHFFIERTGEGQVTGVPFEISFEDVQFWNLDGVEFSSSQVQPTSTQIATVTPNPTKTPTPQPSWVTDFGDPILAYIADQTPKRVDNFETLSSFWNWTNCESNNRYVSDGKLFLKDCETRADFLNTLDFVAELNLRKEQGFGRMGLVIGKDGECRIEVGGGTGGLNDVMNVDAHCSKGNLVSGYVPYTSIVNILIIVKGNDFAYYINHNPMGFSENEFIQGYYPFIRLYSEKVEGIFLASFSDFKLWDISGLNLP